MYIKEAIQKHSTTIQNTINTITHIIKTTTHLQNNHTFAKQFEIITVQETHQMKVTTQTNTLSIRSP